jgi:hypothetical protein
MGGHTPTPTPSAPTAKPTKIWAGDGVHVDRNDHEVRLRVNIGSGGDALSTTSFRLRVNIGSGLGFRV